MMHQCKDCDFNDYSGWRGDSMTTDDEKSTRSGRSILDELEKGDRFEVDCHERTLQVHSTGPFCGGIVLDAYDEGGAQWPVAEIDGQFYLGWSQTTPADEQTRAKEIGAVEPVKRQKQATLDEVTA